MSILRDPRDGSGKLRTAVVEMLNTQMMFTTEGMERHHEIHGLLRKALVDPRRPVRVAAMSRLGPTGDPEAVRLLLESLTHPEGALFQPAEAIRTLSLSGLGERASLVRPFLNHPNPDIRSAAVIALLGDAVSQPRILRMITDPAEPFTARDAAIYALARGVSGAAAPVLVLLADQGGDPRLRARAAAAFAFRLRAPDLTEKERSNLHDGLRRLEPKDLDRIGPAADSLRRVFEQLNKNKETQR
jgi:hypothetical protein